MFELPVPEPVGFLSRIWTGSGRPSRLQRPWYSSSNGPTKSSPSEQLMNRGALLLSSQGPSSVTYRSIGYIDLKNWPL
jgi:hypothetical protein